MCNASEVFIPVADPAAYVREGLESGSLTVRTYVKSTRVRAVPGTPGETVETILKNGLKETENTVGTDPETGVPDWIVTGKDGERYVVKDASFRERYRPDPKEPGVFHPAGKPVDAVRIGENIRFAAPWGEEQFLRAGGWLMLDPGGIYGVEEEAFLGTYREYEPEA